MSLTKHPEGSFREMSAVFLPLWLSLLSTNLMCIVDRWLLSWHSMAAMNGGAVAASLAWALWEVVTVIICMSDVFVARRNGARDMREIGRSVWQMIYVAAASTLFFVPLGIWGSSYLYGDARYYPLEQDCFGLLMMVGPVQALYAALASFWIGRGQTKILFVLVISANIVNVLIDLALIPTMGVKGAVIGTAAAVFLQVVVLAWRFLSAENQKTYGTGRWKLNFKLMRQMLRLGIPPSMLACSELMGGPLVYAMMSGIGEAHLTVSVICQNLTLICWSFSEALYKSSIALMGNLLGSSRDASPWRVILRGSTFVGVFGLIVFVSAAILGPQFAALFFNEDPEALVGLSETMRICLMIAAGYVGLEGMRMMLTGILTAAGDTVFLAVVSSATTWLLLVLPIYFLTMVENPSVVAAIATWLACDACFCAACFLRLSSGRWAAAPVFARAA